MRFSDSQSSFYCVEMSQNRSNRLSLTSNDLGETILFGYLHLHLLVFPLLLNCVIALPICVNNLHRGGKELKNKKQSNRQSISNEYLEVL